MKRLLYILIPLVLLASCQRDGYVARVTDLRLVSVDPKNGYPGDLVTVLGRNFSTDPAQNEVTVGGAPARVLEAYKDRLLIIIPDNAPGIRLISVKGPAGEATGLEFNYLKVPDKEYLVSTIVGQQGVRTCTDGVGTGATTYMPTGINKAADGTLWFTDRGGNAIRHISADMTVSTEVKITESGAAVWQGAFDASGNYWYNDKAKGKLYRFTPSTNTNTMMASGLDNPMNVAVGPDGFIYVPCRNGKVVYKFNPATLEKTEFAQIPDDGPAFIAFDPKGNLIVSVQHGYRIISIDSEGNETTILGTGSKVETMYDDPNGDPLKTTVRSCQGLDIAPDGTMYVGDAAYHCVRKLTPDATGNYANGFVETILGGSKGYADGKGLNAKFNEVDGVLVYDESTLYICDSQNCLIRKVTVK
ncbi:MAG: IPT/TIG domain-containing protein [Bacteroidales bacterium]|nr:IPT/TIG domain-containing protein [Bacteroidales bacterium]